MPPTFSFASAGATNKSSSAVPLSATYQADRTQMSNRIFFHLLYLVSASVPGGTFFECPAERKAVNVGGHGWVSGNASEVEIIDYH